MTDDNNLRTTFNQAASDYNAVRPGYPDDLFTDVISISEIPPGGEALEIGCGTGQATLPFARTGLSILCLDIGPDLLLKAADNLHAYPNVHFELTSFENWPVKVAGFDLVYAATSFHWIPREIGYPKAALAIKPGGALAIFSNAHPRPYTGFFDEVQSVYHQYLPELLDPPNRPTTEAAMVDQMAGIQATGLFRSVEMLTYPWKVSYPTAEYLRLLNTYSSHRAIPEEHRRGLYQAIASLIDTHYDGKVERPYLTELFLAKK